MTPPADDSASASIAAPAACWSCRRDVSSTDRFCRHCGKGQGAHVPWFYKHWGIIVLTLFALGPFSLFLVWRSPVLTRQAKWIYFAVISVFTAYTCVTAYNIWLKISGIAASMLQLG